LFCVVRHNGVFGRFGDFELGWAVNYFGLGFELKKGVRLYVNV
jgi:hypothetical protein